MASVLPPVAIHADSCLPLLPAAMCFHLLLQNAWKFFVYIAQFEDRPFRYTCGFNYSSVSLPAF
jgi:hypothetical protein